MPHTQWIYTDTEYDPTPNDPTKIIQAVFEITETVTELKINGPDLFAHLQRKVTPVSADPAWSNQGHSPAADSDWWYVVHAGQVYSIPVLPDDPQDIDFTTLILEYQLPLAEGAGWCPYSETKGSLDPNAPTVQPCANDIGARIVSNATPYQTAAESFSTCYLLTDEYNTGNILQTFCDGAGIVARKFDHAGTRFGFNWELKSFTGPTAAPMPTPAAQLTDEQVLAKALLNTDQKVYCSWQILGQSGDTVGAWVLCELQVEPHTAGSMPVVIHLDSTRHYGQVEIPRDGNDYVTDIQRLFPLDIQAKILGNNFDLKSLEQGIARRKTGEFTVPYIIPSQDFVPSDYCSWVNEPVPDVPYAGASALIGWSKVTLPETGFRLDVPQYWRVVKFRQSSRVCGNIDEEPHFLKLQTPDGNYQLTIGFRRPDQLVYIAPTYWPAGDFLGAGQVSFFGTEISVSRLVYDGRDMAVFYNSASEFSVGGNLFTLLLAVNSNSNPKDNEGIPQDVEDQVKQILASFQLYPPTALKSTATPSPIQPTAQRLTLLAQRGGSAKGLALSGTTAYVGIGPRLEALDVSDPAAPRLLAQSLPMPGVVSGVLLFPSTPNNSAAAVSAGRYVEVFDTSKPDKIILVDRIVLPGDVTAMVLDRVNRMLYVGGKIYTYYDPNSGPVYDGYVTVVDLHVGIRLGQLLRLGVPIESLAMTRSMLYAAHADDQGAIVLTGIPLVSASQLGQPVTLATQAEYVGSFFSIQAAGDRLYIDSYNALVAYDITNPTAPKELWRSRLGMLAYGFILQPGYIDAMGLARVGDYTFDPVRITPDEAVRTDPQVSTASTVASAGATTYLARDGLEIFDTSDPQNARPLGAYQPPLLVTIDAITRGDLVYTLDTDSFKHNWSQYLHVLRLPDLAIVSEYHFTGFDDAPGWEYFYSMEIEGDRLYLFDYHQGTLVFDLSDPLKPAYLNRPAQLYNGLSAATTGTMGGRRLVFKANPVDISSALVSYDVTDINNITTLSSLDLKDETPQRLAWSGGLLYAVTQGYPPSGNNFPYMFEVFSLENNTLKLESRTPLAGDSRLAARGSLVALSSPQGLVIYSTADPAHPLILSQTPLAGSGAILAFQDNRLLAALQGSSAQLHTFDLSDPTQPHLLSVVDIPPADYFSVSDPTITLSSNFGGIEVLK